MGTSVADQYKQSRLSYLEFLKDPMKHYRQNQNKAAQSSILDQIKGEAEPWALGVAEPSKDVCSFI